MAVHAIEHDGRPGYRWGDIGKSYTYTQGDEAGRSDAHRLAFLDGVARGDTQSMTGDEVQTAIRVSKALGFRKASQNDPDPGAMMIAWYPPADIAKGLSVPGGEPTEALHMTLVHIPAGAMADPKVVNAVALLEAQHHCELDGCISGTGRFVIDEKTDCFYASIDVPGLEDLRNCLIDSLNRAGVWWSQDHGFTPHITLKYLDRAEADPGRLAATTDICVDALSFATPPNPAIIGMTAGQRFDYPLIPMPEPAEADVDVAVDPEVTKRVQLLLETKKHATLEDTEPQPEAELEYSIVHRAAPPDDVSGDAKEWQYTLGLLYAPAQKDAHGEYTDDDTLHKAVVEYSLASAKDPSMRRMKMQHDQTVESGTWVELMRLPADMTSSVTKADGSTTEMTFPAGSVMMGVVWDDAAWDLVKQGKLGGLSLGGRAVRVANAEDPKAMMGYNKPPAQPAGPGSPEGE